MREILFRGKRVDNGEWVYGDYINLYCYSVGEDKGFLRPHIAKEEYNEIDGLEIVWKQVNPETVGQYTGLTDKNGKKIFEGDRVTHGLHEDAENEVVFEDGCFCCGGLSLSVWINLKVIGTIHD